MFEAHENHYKSELISRCHRVNYIIENVHEFNYFNKVELDSTLKLETNLLGLSLLKMQAQ